MPVGLEIARALGAPLDLVLVRKIGAPFQRELAIGAVVDGGTHERVLNEDVIRALELPAGYLERETTRELAEIERRRRRYLEGRAPIPVEGRTAIVVDDGIATGATMKAALVAVRRRRPTRLVLAVPVAPPDTLEALQSEVDEIVCLASPSDLGAIGESYMDFSQLEDEDVQALLAEAPPRAAGRQRP